MQIVTGIAPYQWINSSTEVIITILRGRLPADPEALDAPDIVKTILTACWKPAAERPKMPWCMELLSPSGYLSPSESTSQLQDDLNSSASSIGQQSWRVVAQDHATSDTQFEHLSAFDEIPAVYVLTCYLPSGTY